jgi:hypothetical protein
VTGTAVSAPNHTAPGSRKYRSPGTNVISKLTAKDIKKMQSLTTRDIMKPSVKLVRALQQAKSLEAELARFYDSIEAEMVAHDVRSITGQWGSLSLATRKNWTADQLPARFYKRVLDTTKLNHLYKSGEKLPKGASFSETVYFTKRIK